MFVISAIYKNNVKYGGASASNVDGVKAVKRVQRGSILPKTPFSGYLDSYDICYNYMYSYYVDVNIDSVDLEKSVLLLSYAGTECGTFYIRPTGEFIDENTIRIILSAENNVLNNITTRYKTNWQVIEFY